MNKLKSMLLALALVAVGILVGAPAASAIGTQVYIWEPIPGGASCHTDNWYLQSSNVTILKDSYGNTLVWQPDGNFVRYHNGVAGWATNTFNKGAARLSFQSDGNIVIYTNSNAVLWASHTNWGCNGLTYQAVIANSPYPQWDVEHYENGNWGGVVIG